MGKVFTLSGPSGVGKTTFLNQLSRRHDRSSLRVLPRYTDRPRRQGEEEGFEYFFTSQKGILQKVFANDFIHIEKWGDYYSAIETRIIERVFSSPYHGIVLASTFGASRLRATYGINIKCLYMWCGDQASLFNPRCFEPDSDEVQELKWRIAKKLRESGFSEFETAKLTNDQFLEKRMVDNNLDIASVNGRLRSGEDIRVLPNLHDRMEDVVREFEKVVAKAEPADPNAIVKHAGGCFVLMPFREEYRPIYEDHIVPVCQSMNIEVTRADQIFSTRPIITDIVDAVKTAKIIIADLTDRNPNVFYEIGLCHATGKEVVLITQEAEAPFDLAHLRRIRYQYHPRGMKLFEDALRGTLETILRDRAAGSGRGPK
jgi:guanylate kinase